MTLPQIDGLEISPWDKANPQLQFAKEPYHFSRILLQKSATLELDNFDEVTILASPRWLWHASGKKISVPVPEPQREVWIAGHRPCTKQDSRMDEAANPYLVKKPWGSEEWLSPSSDQYCFKRININAGHRTSLQFHRQKEETNVLLSGKLRLFYYPHRLHQNDESFDPTKLNSLVLDGPHSIHILPYTIHRMEAISDLCFLEISTAQVNDVVRLQDDANRPSGRIDSEHAT